MNYQLHYNKLMIIAKNRVFTGYSESHHIIPRCLGGSDDPSNLVNLTAREHFVAHQLLAKMHPDSDGLQYAAFMMMRSRTGKNYDWLRRVSGEATRRRQIGRVIDESVRQKISATKKGSKYSDLHKKAQSEGRKGLIWINNGIISKQIRGVIPDGWVRGRYGKSSL